MAKESLEIDVFEFARERGSVSGSLPLARFERLAEAVRGGSDVAFRFDGKRDEQARPAAHLQVAATLTLTCDRCGEPVDLPLDLASDFWFVHSEDELNGLPIANEDSEPLLGSKRFSLVDLVEDELLLALPISPRHASCGAGGETEFEAESASRRPFAALASLKTRH